MSASDYYKYLTFIKEHKITFVGPKAEKTCTTHSDDSPKKDSPVQPIDGSRYTKKSVAPIEKKGLDPISKIQELAKMRL